MHQKETKNQDKKNTSDNKDNDILLQEAMDLWTAFNSAKNEAVKQFAGNYPGTPLTTTVSNYYIKTTNLVLSTVGGLMNYEDALSRGLTHERAVLVATSHVVLGNLSGALCAKGLSAIPLINLNPILTAAAGSYIGSRAYEDCAKEHVDRAFDNLFSTYDRKMFEASLIANGLGDSYNRSCPLDPIPGYNVQYSEIGGVANKVGIIEGVKNSTDQIFFNEHIFCIPSNGRAMPFTDAELKQILRELAIGIYIHKTYPFFSLHFNNDHKLYPVIHPAYQNTLVGDVIAILDYYMKGFLNGGIFDKNFLQDWDKEQITDRDYLKSKLIDIKEYCKKNLSGFKYVSLRELMSKYGLESEEESINDNPNSIYKTKFNTSFRIIAKQGSISKYENIFLMNPEFDIEYSIELMPDYKQYLESYKQRNGYLPEDYIRLTHLYELIAQSIKQEMPKLPFCRDYFQMLGIINFFCYYYTTLQEIGKVPILDSAPMVYNGTSPKVYPPIPVRYYKHLNLNITYTDFINKILVLEKRQTKYKMDFFYEQLFENLATIQPDALSTRIKLALVELIKSKIPDDVGVIEESEIDSEYIEQLYKKIDFELKSIVTGLKSSISNSFKDISDSANKIYGFLVAGILSKEFSEYQSQFEQINLSNLPPKYNNILIKINNSGKVGPVLLVEEIEQRKTLEEKLGYIKSIIDKKLEATTKIINQNATREYKKIEGTINIEGEKAKKILEDNIRKKSEKFEIELQKQKDKVISRNCYSLQQASYYERKKFENELDAKCDEAREEFENQVREELQDLKDKLRLSKSIAKKEIQKKKEYLLKEIQSAHSEIVSLLDKHKKIYKSITKWILENEQISKINVITNYDHSTLSIADNDFYKEVGDNVSIVGGCGLSLQNIAPTEIQQGERLAKKILINIQDKDPEQFSQIKHQGQNYTIFRLKVKDKNIINFFDYTYLLDSFSDDTVSHRKTSSNEYEDFKKLLLKSVYNESDVEINYDSINLTRRDKAGQTILHHISGLVSKPVLEKLISKKTECITQQDKLGYWPIHVAARAGNTEAVEYMINLNKECLEAKTQDDRTPLILAAERGQTSVISSLLRLGANPNHILPNGLFALYIAIQNKYQAAALCLLNKRDTKVDIVTDNDNSPLHLAIDTDQGEVAKALIVKGADVHKRRKTDGYTPLHCAGIKGRSEILKAIIKTKSISVDERLDSGQTVLHLSAAGGHIEAVRTLVTLKADINIQDNNGNTSLMVAILNNQIDIAHYLAQFSSINIINNFNETALLQAARKGMYGVASILISRGENQDLSSNKNLDKVNPKEADYEIIKKVLLSNQKTNVKQLSNDISYYLLRNGQYYLFTKLFKEQKINPKGEFLSSSSLGVASQYKHGMLMDFLKEQQIVFKLNNSTNDDFIYFAVKVDDVSSLREWVAQQPLMSKAFWSSNINDKEVRTLMYIAAENSSLNCLKELLSIKGDNYCNAFNNKHLLYGAIISHNKKVLKEVLAHCTDPNICVDEHQNTAAHIAAEHGLLHLITVLNKRGITFCKLNDKKYTPMHLAILNDDRKMLKLLLKLIETASLPQDLLSFAMIHKKSKCIEFLLKNYNLGNSINGEKDKLVLLNACKNNNINQVKALLNIKYDVNEATSEGIALHTAIEHSSIEIIELLLNAQADPFLIFNGEDAIKVAIKHNRIDALHLLHKYEFRSFLLSKVTSYSKISQNPYILEALEGRSEKFDTDKKRLLSAFDNRNYKDFEEILKIFPINNTLFPTEEGILKPFLHFVFKLDPIISGNYACSIIELIKDKVDPRVKDSKGLGIIFNLEDDNEVSILEKLKWVDKYFGRYKQEILEQANYNDFTLTEKLYVSGKNNLAKLFLENGFSINYKDKEGKSLLHFAAVKNDIDMAQYLISKGVIPDITDQQRATPLMLAAASGSIKILESLVSQGANIDAVDIYQDSALHYAIKAKQSDSALFLANLSQNIIDKNRNGHTPLMLAAISGLNPIVQFLGFKMAKINQFDVKGLNALHLAAIYGNTEIIKLLVDIGMDIDCETQYTKKNKLKNTALHLAASHGRVQAFTVLIELGASITKEDIRGWSAIQYAVKSNDKEITNLVTQLSSFYMSSEQPKLLLAAALGNNVIAVKQLLNNRCPINSLDKFGGNALHYAAYTNAHNVAALLMELGINLKATAGNGNTPLHESALNGSINVLKLLCEQQIELDAKNQEGKTALHLACEQGQYTAVVQLILAGADLYITDNKGMTPGQLTLLKWHEKVIDLLLILGDQSLKSNVSKDIPSYLRQCYEALEVKLIEFEKNIQECNLLKMNALHISIVLKHSDAISLLCKTQPQLIQQIDINGKKPIQYAIQSKNYSAVRIIKQHENQLLKQEANTNLLAKSQKQPNIFNVAQLIELLGKYFTIRDDNILKRISETFSSLPVEASTLFFGSLINMQSKQRLEYINNWLNLLDKLSRHPEFYEKFTYSFLIQYSWDVLYSNPEFFELLDNLTMENQEILQQWFWKYFEPTVSYPLEHTKFNKALNLFREFMDECLQAKVGNLISSPPQKNISFQLSINQSYLELCILALQKSTDKKMQSSFLNLLPSIKILNNAFHNNFPFVCQMMVSYGAIQKITNIEVLDEIYDYKTLKSQALSYLAYNRNLQFKEVLSFFSILEKIDTNELNIEEKMVVIRCIMHLSNGGIDQSKISMLLELAIQVKAELGYRVFRKLFTAVPTVQSARMTYYIEICSLLLELHNVININELIGSCLPDLQGLLGKLEEEQLKYLHDKFPESDLEVALNRFASKSDFVRFPLSSKDIKILQSTYLNISEYAKTIKSKSLVELSELAQIQGIILQKNPQDNEASIKLLATIREVIRHCFKIYPYNTQVLSVIGLIHFPEEFKGRIAQIRTGEGKSTIIAMLAAYMACQGKFIDIITSSRTLAIRDQEKYEKFFARLGISCSHICYDQQEQQHFNGVVLYATNYDFEFSILRDQLYNEQKRFTEIHGKKIRRTCEVVIVDEVDNLFLDTALNAARIALPSAEDTSWVYEPILNYVKQNISKQLDCKMLREILKQYCNGRYIKQATEFTNERLKMWISSAKIAIEKEEGKDYIIDNNSSSINENKVIIVDFQNTGSLNHGSRWSYGIHEFLEVKHGFKPKAESLTSASISHPAFFKEYKTIFGLTGTVGEEQERKEIKAIYNVDIFDVPPHFPNLRKALPNQYFQDKKVYYQAIIDEVKSVIKQNRPVLALFRTINESIAFANKLKEENIRHYVINEMQKEDSNYILSRAGRPKSVTIATNTAGRGTDIILSQESIKNGGLHVIFGFYPANLRVEDQGMGRAGRQGQSGTCRMFTHSRDEEVQYLVNRYLSLNSFVSSNFIEYLNQLRSEKVKSLSLERTTNSAIETINYQILKRFCSYNQKFSNELKQISISELILVCKNYNTYKIGLSIHNPRNPLTIGLHKLAYSLAQSHQQGNVVDWAAFLDVAREAFLSVILQEWAYFYSNLHIDKSVGNLQSYETILNNKFNNFIKSKVGPIFNDPTKYFKSYILELLSTEPYKDEQIMSEREKNRTCNAGNKISNQSIMIHDTDIGNSKEVEDNGALNTIDLNLKTTIISAKLSGYINQLSQWLQVRKGLNNTNYYKKGDESYLFKKYEEAIKHFNKAILIEPNNAEYYNRRGNAYYAQGKYKEAIEDYSQAIELKPNNETYYSNRGMAYNKLKDYENAIKDFNAAISINFRNDEGYNRKGNAYYAQGKYKEAIEDYSQAIELKPNNETYYSNRGMAYNELKDYENAIKDFNAAISI
ncbi:hypothetical protein NF27_GI00070, partial [Candidatus Jidaibacter acanthamoeba]